MRSNHLNSEEFLLSVVFLSGSAVVRGILRSIILCLIY